jgi:hypothetical protein
VAVPAAGTDRAPAARRGDRAGANQVSDPTQELTRLSR